MLSRPGYGRSRSRHRIDDALHFVVQLTMLLPTDREPHRDDIGAARRSLIICTELCGKLARSLRIVFRRASLVDRAARAVLDPTQLADHPRAVVLVRARRRLDLRHHRVEASGELLGIERGRIGVTGHGGSAAARSKHDDKD
jgi:hypothetical protein